MPQTVWLSYGDLKCDRETARGSAQDGSIRKDKLGVGKGKLCPLRGCKDSPPEGLNEVE
jgi:hypothetical protein